MKNNLLINNVSFYALASLFCCDSINIMNEPAKNLCLPFVPNSFRRMWEIGMVSEEITWSSNYFFNLMTKQGANLLSHLSQYFGNFATTFKPRKFAKMLAYGFQSFSLNIWFQSLPQKLSRMLLSCLAKNWKVEMLQQIRLRFLLNCSYFNTMKKQVANLFISLVMSWLFLLRLSCIDFIGSAIFLLKAMYLINEGSFTV